jgi:hypothetical protein
MVSKLDATKQLICSGQVKPMAGLGYFLAFERLYTVWRTVFLIRKRSRATTRRLGRRPPNIPKLP